MEEQLHQKPGFQKPQPNPYLHYSHHDGVAPNEASPNPEPLQPPRGKPCKHQPQPYTHIDDVVFKEEHVSNTHAFKPGPCSGASWPSSPAATGGTNDALDVASQPLPPVTNGDTNDASDVLPITVDSNDTIVTSLGMLDITASHNAHAHSQNLVVDSQ